ncbi:ABC-2 type transporter [Isosphaera pallida ATCC 43644]|uniref:Transport permease protein n=2 Tax=Isosphaera pallida TaxID=128 RepID=E8R454_ISOPI|nr:ABC-2 type transporter [Isosphaera pallida ATCC 43644]
MSSMGSRSHPSGDGLTKPTPVGLAEMSPSMSPISAEPQFEPWTDPRTGRFGQLLDDLENLWKARYVVSNLVRQELRVRYQRSSLGFLWSLLNPLMLMSMMSLVFSQVFQLRVTDYALYLFAGMLPWTFFSLSINESSTSLIANECLIRKVPLPKAVFPLARVLINLTTLLLSLTAFSVLFLALGARPSWAILSLPLVLALLTLFTLGMGLTAAILNTFFRDFGHIIGVLLQALYFLTPILYTPAMLPESSRWKFWLNPLYSYITSCQQILHDGQWPGIPELLVGAILAMASLVLGYLIFKTNEAKVVFRL